MPLQFSIIFFLIFFFFPLSFPFFFLFPSSPFLAHLPGGGGGVAAGYPGVKDGASEGYPGKVKAARTGYPAAGGGCPGGLPGGNAYPGIDPSRSCPPGLPGGGWWLPARLTRRLAVVTRGGCAAQRSAGRTLALAGRVVVTCGAPGRLRAVSYLGWPTTSFYYRQNF